MAKVNQASAKRFWRAYARAHYQVEDSVPTELELKGVLAGLRALQEADEATAEHVKKGDGKFGYTVLVFTGEHLWAMGKALSLGEIREFWESLFGSDLPLHEFPPEAHQ